MTHVSSWARFTPVPILSTLTLWTLWTRPTWTGGPHGTRRASNPLWSSYTVRTRPARQADLPRRTNCTGDDVKTIRDTENQRSNDETANDKNHPARACVRPPRHSLLFFFLSIHSHHARNDVPETKYIYILPDVNDMTLASHRIHRHKIVFIFLDISRPAPRAFQERRAAAPGLANGNTCRLECVPRGGGGPCRYAAR